VSDRARMSCQRPMPRLARVWRVHGGSGRAQRPVMMNFPELPPVPSDRLIPYADPLRLAVAAYLVCRA
jgi:hypothetical protein